MRLSRLVPYALAFSSSMCIMILELVASRLVAQHVGASLIVWTSVIGIILAGICLGNVLGGRLADRVPPRLALGTLYALGAALTLACLWINGFVMRIPGLDTLPWDLRTLLVVSLDFLVPATVLGMISPVVAKMAVEQAEKTGSAIGDVYFWGAVGSIAGTFIAGFWLIDIAPTTTIVAVVAAGLALLACALNVDLIPRGLSLLTCILLLASALPNMGLPIALPNIAGLPFRLNPVAAAAHLCALLAAITAWFPLGTMLSIGPPQPKAAPRVDLVGLKKASESAVKGKSAVVVGGTDHASLTAPEPRESLRDLATLAFLASLGFMALEMVAGRLVTRHLGSSVFGWTSVIGVLLGGLSIGNWLGGKLANHITSERHASSLFLVASALVLTILLMETPPDWLVSNPLGYFFGGEKPVSLLPEGKLLSQALVSSGMPGWLRPWWFRVLFWTGVQFLPPAIAMGTVSPVVAKLAVDRLQKSGRTGRAIGSVYAWGMVGSILGTFLAGFWLIDVFGTKGVIILLATVMALAATSLGSIWHAAWAGIPLGLCVIAFAPPYIPGGLKGAIPLPGQKRIELDSSEMKAFLLKQGQNWGLREPTGDPNDPSSNIAYIDESNYYYIKVNNSLDESGTKRTLVLDNLIHGYEVLGQPRRLDYDYEHIYALVTHRILQAKAARAALADASKAELGTLFLGGGSYTFPRYLQSVYPRTWAEIAEIDPAVTRANHIALGLPWPEPGFPEPKLDGETGREVVSLQRQTIPLGPNNSAESRDAYVKALEQIIPPMRHDEKTGEAVVSLDGREIKLGPFGSEDARKRYLAAAREWFTTSKYRIRTTWGDARQYAAKHQDLKFDIVYGDAFNDFSVPWHLTTREFNELVNNMLTDHGVYMINIIDLYDSDEHAARSAPRKALQDKIAQALRGRWNGARTPEEIASGAMAYLTTPELSAEWDLLGTWATNALDGKSEEVSRDTIIAGLKQQRDEYLKANPKSQFEATPVDELAKSIEVVLATSHGTEAMTILDDARADLIHRYKRGNPDVLETVAAAIDTARTEAGKQTLVESRAKTIDELFEQLIETAASLGNVSPNNLADTITSLAKQLQENVDAKKIPAERSAAIFLLLGRIYQVASRDVTEDKPLTGARARAAAVEVAQEVARELGRVRSQVASRLATVQAASAQNEALSKTVADASHSFLTDRDAWIELAADAIIKARQVGGFLGSWVETARLTFPHIYVYGTHRTIGSGQRETFVVVASKAALDLDDLSLREGDLAFETDGVPTVPKIYPPSDMAALKLRSHKLILTDDHAPVENLLAPVAATRGED